MTDELTSIADLAKRAVASGAAGTLSTLFCTDGFTYRPLGSMRVSLPGAQAGGITDDIDEYVLRVGERLTRRTPSVMLYFDPHGDADPTVSVTARGGSIGVLVERITSAHVALLEACANAAGRDDCSLLACVVRRDGESVAVARQWLVPGASAIGTSGMVLARLRDDARRLEHSVHRIVAPDTDALIHYVPPMTRLIIFGAGDDARPLCEIGASLGWHVSVADRRGRLATSARFPGAREIVVGSWEEAVAAMTYSSRTAVVMMTHNRDDDARVLSLLPRRLPYLGVLGTAHHRNWLQEEASTLMVASDVGARCGGAPEAAPLRGPIGLDLGDRSPRGIALAVVAEILAQLNRRQARPLHSAVDVAPPRSGGGRRSAPDVIVTERAAGASPPSRDEGPEAWTTGLPFAWDKDGSDSCDHDGGPSLGGE